MNYFVNKLEMVNWPLLGRLDGNTLSKLKSFKYHGNHFYGITNDLKTMAFGENSEGLLGLGHKNEIFQAEKIEELSGKIVKDIVCGFGHTMVLTNSGELWVWGTNKYGQLGIGNTTDCISPKLIVEKDIIEAKCGWHTLALTKDGKILACGFNSSGQVGNGTIINQLTITKIDSLNGKNITQIDCGIRHSMALTADHEVYGWGSNVLGQLGIGKDSKDQSVPVKVNIGQKVKKIACGKDSTLFLTIEAKLYICGSGISSAKLIKCVPNVDFDDILAINYVSPENGQLWLASSKNGEIYIWGDTKNNGNIVEPLNFGHSIPEGISTYSAEAISPIMLEWRGIDCFANSPLADKLSSLFDSNDMSDFKFVFPDGQVIHAHRLLLSIMSDYLKAQLSSVWSEEEQLIRPYSYQVYHKYIKFLYTGLLDLDTYDEATEMLNLAVYYNEEKLKQNCIDLIIISFLNLETCYKLFEFAIQCGMLEFEGAIFNFMAKNYLKVIVAEGYCQMSKENIKKFNCEFSEKCKLSSSEFHKLLIKF